MPAGGSYHTLRVSTRGLIINRTNGQVYVVPACATRATKTPGRGVALRSEAPNTPHAGLATRALILAGPEGPRHTRPATLPTGHTLSMN
jgi:hypothetical protein